jgi:hypothetical protein
MTIFASKSDIRKFGWVVISLVLVLGFVFCYGLPKYRNYDDPTAEYLRGFDICELYSKGADWLNVDFDPVRIGLCSNTIYTREYDFRRLEKAEIKLANVERHQALIEIFSRITTGSGDQREKHIALLRFLQRVSLNWKLQPMYPDGQAVFDPLVLLELTEMRCGQVARLGVDLWAAGGGKGRIVQLANHVSAEVFYDGEWHLLEGDIWENGVVIMNEDGTIPSLEEMSLDPYRIDMLPPQYWAPNIAKSYSVPYLSFYFFNKKAYDGAPVQFYYKTATAEEERHSKWFGWNYYSVQKSTSINLSDDSPRYQPSAVTITSIDQNSEVFTIRWTAAVDQDGDLLGYRIFIGKTSRGWTYNQTKSPDKLRQYILLGWLPTMYDKVNILPPAEFGIIEVVDNHVTVKVPLGQVRYITVMPFDAHGEKVSRKIYFMSDEVRISNTSAG